MKLAQRPPLDPARHRAFVASIYTSQSLAAQREHVLKQWPRIIHKLAHAGDLATPEFDERCEGDACTA